MSYGHHKTPMKQTIAYGWLNPYWGRTWDGNTIYEHYEIISNTYLNQYLRDQKFEFVELEEL